jgi:hypothetical protein
MDAPSHLLMLAVSYPSPREAVGREGRSEAEARVRGCVVESPPTPTLARSSRRPRERACSPRTPPLAALAGGGIRARKDEAR